MPREAEASLNARVSEILKPLRQPGDGAVPPSFAPTEGGELIF
jgi:hypothetical protein